MTYGGLEPMVDGIREVEEKGGWLAASGCRTPPPPEEGGGVPSALRKALGGSWIGDEADGRGRGQAWGGKERGGGEGIGGGGLPGEPLDGNPSRCGGDRITGSTGIARNHSLRKSASRWYPAACL